MNLLLLVLNTRLVESLPFRMYLWVVSTDLFCLASLINIADPFVHVVEKD